MDSVNANTLTEVTTVPTNKKLIFTDPDTNEGGIITMENLTKQVLQNLTSQAFALDAGNMTIPAALNQLNSDSLPNIAERITQMPDGTKAKLLSVGGTSVNVGNTGEKIPAWSFGIFLPSTYGSDACAIFANTNQITVAYKSSNNWVSCKKILY